MELFNNISKDNISKDNISKDNISKDNISKDKQKKKKKISKDKQNNIIKDKQKKKKKIRIPKVPLGLLDEEQEMYFAEQEMYFAEEEMYFEELGIEKEYFEKLGIEKDEIEKEMESEKVHWIDLYTFLFEAGIVFLSDKLNKENSKIILGLITYLSMLHPIGEFFLFLNNCVSGCLRTAIAMHDAIQQLPRPGYTVACGMTASAGSLILVSGHERMAQINARILIQEPKWKFKIPKFTMKRKKKTPRIIYDKRNGKKDEKGNGKKDEKGNGKKDEKRKKRQNLRRYVDVHEAKQQLTKYVHEIYVSKTGQSYDIIQKDLKKNVVMSAKKAQDYGIIDRIWNY